MDISMHRDSSWLHFGHKWLTHFGCANGFLGLCHTFFWWGFILKRGAYRWSLFLKRCPNCFGHFVFMCGSSTSLFHTGNTFFFFLPIYFVGFWQESYACMWGHYGSKIMGVFSRPFSKVLDSTINIFWWYKPFFSIKDYAPFVFMGSWVLVAPYLCFRFCIFDRPVLEEYISQVEGGPHLLQSCLCLAHMSFLL
jgi:hypothetical protein